MLLRGAVRRAGAMLILTLALLDAQARTFGPIRVSIDPFIENPRVLVDALESLDRARSRPAASPSPPMAAPPAAPKATAPPVAGLTKKVEQQSTPATKTGLVPAAAVAREAPALPGTWMNSTGNWMVAGSGLALLGGFATGLLGNRLSSQLSDKYAAHTLTTADATSYRQVHRYAVAANGFFIAAGALSIAGLTLWALAPEVGEGPSIGLSRSF